MAIRSLRWGAMLTGQRRRTKVMKQLAILSRTFIGDRLLRVRPTHYSISIPAFLLFRVAAALRAAAFRFLVCAAFLPAARRFRVMAALFPAASRLRRSAASL